MLKKGRVCYKIAGRDPGVCVVLDEKDGRYLVFGPNVRKRYINPAHLEPLPQVIDVENEEKALEELKKIEESIKKKGISKLELWAMKAKARKG